MNSKAIFVTGTDTGAGKTIVTGFLARYLKEKGNRVITQKWIQTGSLDFSADIDAHLEIMGCDRKYIKDYLPYVSPYIFKAPCSPHLACKTENKSISAKRIKRSFEILSSEFDFVIVEGIGGALVPFNPILEIPGFQPGDERGFLYSGREPWLSGRGGSTKKRFVIDIAKELDLPILVVARNKLGAINHTLLTIEALKNRGMKMLGIVFNNAKGENKKILADNPRIIQALSGDKILGVLPWMKGYDDLYKKFIPIGYKVFSLLMCKSF